MFFFVSVDKFLGGAFCACGGIVGAEEKSIAVLAAKFHCLCRTPGVTADDWILPSQLVGLLNDQSNLIIVLRSKQYFSARLNDLSQLGTEISIPGSKTFISYNGTGAVYLFPGFFKKLGEPLGIIAGNII